MGKPKKTTPTKDDSKQSKISSFFQAGGQENGCTRKSALFSSVNQQFKTKNRLTQSKMAPLAVPNIAGSSMQEDSKTPLIEAKVEAASVSTFKKTGVPALAMPPGSMKTKEVLSNASHIIKDILREGGTTDKNVEVALDDSVTCIPETQFCDDLSPETTDQHKRCVSRTPCGTTADETDSDVIPDTPDVAASKNTGLAHGKRQQGRSFLTSSSMGLKNTLQQRLSTHLPKKQPKKRTKIPQGAQPRSLEEALKSSDADLEFASPESFTALVSGVGFAGPVVTKQSAKTELNGQIHAADTECASGSSSGKSKPSTVGSLSGIKRASQGGYTPKAKRTLRKTPVKRPPLTATAESTNENINKFSRNLSKSWMSKTLMNSQGKLPKDCTEKDIHLNCDQDGDLCDILDEFKNENIKNKSVNVSGRTSVCTPNTEGASEIKLLDPEKSDREMVGSVGHDEPDEGLDDIISELRQTLTQSQKKEFQFKSRLDKSILAEGLSLPNPLREVKTAKRKLNTASTRATARGNQNPSIDLEVTLSKGEGHDLLGSPKSRKTDDTKMDEFDLDTCDLEMESVAMAVEKDLAEDFEHMSPFKQEKTQTIQGYTYNTAAPPSTHFGRCKVREVQNSGDDVVLVVDSVPGDESRRVLLTGFWTEVHVEVDDIIHVIGEFGDDGTITISDSQNLIVVNPDLLISGTSVVSSIHCMRRAVLAERFKGYDGKNIYMLYGTIVHSFFQRVVQQKAFNKAAMEGIAAAVLRDSKVLHDMYGQNVTEATVLEEIRKYYPQLLTWAEKHIGQKQFTFGQKPAERTDVIITQLADIEENVWSPRFGIKGKIDLTVEVKIHEKQKKPTQKLMPLELKTGKPTYSIEHKGQVTLYSMMSSDRRDDPEAGLLLYLKDGSMKTIPADHVNKRGLVQLRNELAHHLRQNARMTEGSVLPPPINSVRSCSRCPHLLNCAAYQRVIEKVAPPEGHAMSTLEPETLTHLKLSHLEYYRHWVILMMLELSTGGSRGGVVSDIWCKTAWEREQKGECLCGMTLAPPGCGDKQLDNGNFLQTFIRVKGHPSQVKVDDVGVAMGDSLVVSAENRPLIALSQGFVMAMTETSVTLLLDRDLRAAPDHRSLVFRLDKADTYNTMGSNLTNLARLMENSDTSAKLRDIVIDKKTPEFETTMSKGIIEKVKSAFKTLNKPQKTAILKVLMCKDYVLIKGYPGTGKTSTIVSLVRILTALGRSVLLTSYTHSAVDNILLKLKKHDVDFVRLGRLERIHSGVHSHAAELLTKSLTTVDQLTQFYDSKNVVATTCLGISGHPLFTRRKFSVCIVDEASQVLQPACLAPLFVSHKFVLVGDPLQLPPVVQHKQAREDGMAESLFARLDEAGGTYELNLQYRMNEEIMRLSNELVYSGALRCGTPSVAQGRLELPTLENMQVSAEWIQRSLSGASGMEVIFLDTDKLPDQENQGDQRHNKNETEAEIVQTLIDVTIKAGVSQDDIGVITPYRHQVRLLRDRLTSRDHGGVEVNTVDQYQGRDKAFIIVSFVKRGPGQAAGILADLRRLNVALTRARHKLVMVGSATCLSAYTPLKAVLAVLRPHQMIQIPADWVTPSSGCCT